MSGSRPVQRYSMKSALGPGADSRGRGTNVGDRPIFANYSKRYFMLSEPPLRLSRPSEFDDELLRNIDAVQEILDRMPPDSPDYHLVYDHFENSTRVLQESYQEAARLKHGGRRISLTFQWKNVVKLLAMIMVAAMVMIYFR